MTSYISAAQLEDWVDSLSRMTITYSLGFCSVHALTAHGTPEQWSYAEDLRELASQMRALP